MIRITISHSEDARPVIHPGTCTLPGYRLQGLATLLKCSPYSLLMLANFSNKHIATARGCIYCRKGIGLTSTASKLITCLSSEARAHLNLSEKEIDSIIIREIILEKMKI